MPRGSTTTKRLRGPTTHASTNNDNRITTASKRTQKQKNISLANGLAKGQANGQLNGQVDDHANNPHSLPTSLSPPPTPPSTTERFSQYSSLHDKATDGKMESGFVRTDSASYSDSSSELYQNALEVPMHENHRVIEFNATKNLAVHRDLSRLGFAITVLKSCPLRDTLAILIVLLQIPPTFLSIIHFLFAALTSVANSGLTYRDIFKGTMDTRTVLTAVVTTLFWDFVALFIWSFLWTPIQELAVYMAQAVIALTLGGASGCKTTGIKNIFWYFGIIGASYVFRTSHVKHHAFQESISSKISHTLDPDDPLGPAIHSNGMVLSLIRRVLAIHILTQGAAQYLCDCYGRRNNQDISENLGDPEAGKSVINLTSDLSLSQTTENEPSISLESSNINFKSKKKKKDCAPVGNRQLLWAALASIKIIIVMVKEYEKSHPVDESAGASKTCKNDHRSATFSTEPDKIWITYVGSDKIFFSTSFFSTSCPNYQDEAAIAESPNTDKSKPFYIKVNKDKWQPTKIYALTGLERKPGPSTKWSGVISGLAPMSNYTFDFISTMDESLLFSTSVRTLQSSTTEFGLSFTAKNVTCPSTSHLALKTSIALESKKLEEDRQRQKSSRKELRAKINSVRKEFERVLVNIASTGGNDDKMRQKVQQSTLHMKKADEAAMILASQIGSINNIPTDETSVYSESKKEIQLEREKHNNICSEINFYKRNAERKIQALNSELCNLQQKFETRKQRLNILKAKYESILDAKTKGFDEAQRRESELEVKRKERSKIKAIYTERLQSFDSKIYEGQVAHHEVAAAIESLLQVQQDMCHGHSPSLSSQNSTGLGSDSISANSSITLVNYPWTAAPVNPPSTFSGHGSISQVTNAAVSPLKLGHRTRGRSSSLLSNVSKFKKSSSDDGPLLSIVGKKLLGWEDTMEDLRISGGSMSGSGSGVGSIGDLRSPIFTNSKVTSKV